jgi:hypothetical protein
MLIIECGNMSIVMALDTQSALICITLNAIGKRLMTSNVILTDLILVLQVLVVIAAVTVIITVVALIAAIVGHAWKGIHVEAFPHCIFSGCFFQFFKKKGHWSALIFRCFV